MAGEKLLIPSTLYGTHRDCKPKWVRRLKAAYSTGSWEIALAKSDWIDIWEIDGDLLLDGPADVATVENVLLYLGWAGFRNFRSKLPQEVRSSRSDHENTNRLLLTGSERFWFCLCMLAVNADFPFPFDQREQYKAELYPKVIRNILRWWPHFVELDYHFCLGVWRGWPQWFWRLSRLCSEAGVPWNEVHALESGTIEEAEKALRGWFGK
jgi:hypothetical protein